MYENGFWGNLGPRRRRSVELTLFGFTVHTGILHGLICSMTVFNVEIAATTPHIRGLLACGGGAGRRRRRRARARRAANALNLIQLT
jgi:hypothetical protein